MKTDVHLWGQQRIKHKHIEKKFVSIV